MNHVVQGVRAVAIASVLLLASLAGTDAQADGGTPNGGDAQGADLVSPPSGGMQVTRVGDGTYALHGTPQTQLAMGSSTTTTVTSELAVQPGHRGGTSPGRTLKFTTP